MPERKKLEPSPPPIKSYPISDELKKLLEEEAQEAEIQSAIDAAAEEGLTITREETIDILRPKETDNKGPNGSPQNQKKAA